jgi:NADPH-dependent 2,4-dienoyl-CoA reductase/sulfur reductase-like enzyme/rhodanese-related sulfurtransferase
MAKRVLIVGGVAGGASCAARLRRLSEEAEIVLFDRGPYVSFANCGLPYYVGDIIREENKLLIASAELFKERFNIEVRTGNEVVSIDRERREIEVRCLQTGAACRERYDALVLSPGAMPVRPPLPGIDLSGIFTLRSIPDSRAIRSWIEERNARRAVVVGGGLVGLEMVENLSARGISVTVVEMLDQVLPPLDPEMAAPIQQHLVENGVTLHLRDAVAGFAAAAQGALTVNTKSGSAFPADLVILAIGVRPEVGLAKDAGLALGQRGGIRVDEAMLTSDPYIWAVGDAVEVRDMVTGEWNLMPLAGPANRQGRVAADSICGRTDTRFAGMLGTAVCGVLGFTAAVTGANEKTLRRTGMPYRAIYLHPAHHAGYYPGAKPIHMKLLFSPADGRMLGAQAVGEEGVEKRIDVISMAIQNQATVYDLEQAELCYAPQYGSAKDPVNLAGMIAANVLRGDAPLARWEELSSDSAVVLDVRDGKEFEQGHIEGAINIPLPQLRQRLAELPRDGEILVNCGVGQRSYYALRILLQHGFAARNLPGGFTTYLHRRAQAAVPERTAAGKA